MRPISTRADILAVAAQAAPSKACATAISENRATVLGGFTPAGGLPCFVVVVISKFGRQWILAVEVDEAAHRYRPKVLDAVPWIAWDGRIGGKRLIDGDVPIEAAMKRMKERRRAKAI